MTPLPGPSSYVSWRELSCHDLRRTPYPRRWRTTRARRVAAAFEAVRALHGVPLTVTSAYRTPLYNVQIGGAEASQHCEGLALDVRPPEGVPVRTWWREVYELAQREPALGIHYVKGYAGGWVHWDLRDGEAVIAEWEE